jgi:hypothetical protein
VLLLVNDVVAAVDRLAVKNSPGSARLLRIWPVRTLLLSRQLVKLSLLEAASKHQKL